ncbi:MAG: GGDEF domain-containing protein [Leptolyngbyaceae bacterium]|nr:GGDEF domain-containing protein [Leptolyngbyaceae bacterium]
MNSNLLENRLTQLIKQNILGRLETLPRWLVLSLSVALTLLIGSIDFAIQFDLSLSIFYLIPVAIATWFLNFQAGMGISLLSTVAWLHADAAAKDASFSLLLYWNAVVRLGFFSLVTYLLAALKEAYSHEQQMARIDGLTGIYNRRFFLELLTIELDRARRYHYPLTLAYIDLDDFKRINDQFGHDAGDSLLRLVAQTLDGAVRSHDFVGRLGGDEFAIVLPQINSPQAIATLSRIHHQLNQLSQSNHWRVGFSIGAMTFTRLPDSVDCLISQADQLMYAVKQTGKNRLECHDYASP